jgi:hypothetical protein
VRRCPLPDAADRAATAAAGTDLRLDAFPVFSGSIAND